MPKIGRFLFLIFLILGMIIALFPNLDLEFSNMFYDAEEGFLYKRNIFVLAIYKSVPLISTLLTFGFLLYIATKYFIFKKYNLVLQSRAIYLLIALALGPGLLVNGVLKENFGRARPSQINAFQGDKQFTAPIMISNQCDTNCSFSSGHAASGYYFTAFSWVIPYWKNIIFLSGFVFGSLVGFGRILQGGHFLSDVVFSFIFIIISNEVSYRLWNYLKAKFKGKNAIRK